MHTIPTKCNIITTTLNATTEIKTHGSESRGQEEAACIHAFR